MVQTERDISAWVADFDSFEGAEHARSPGWLRDLRRSGIARFADVGFPDPKNEDWRYTNTSRIARAPFRLAPDAPAAPLGREAAARWSFGNSDWVTLVFVNGGFAPGLSRVEGLPRGARVGPLIEAVAGRQDGVEERLGRMAAVTLTPFVALNTAFLRDGAVVRIPEGVLVEQPIHLLFLTDPGSGDLSVHPRILVAMGAGSRATIVEQHAALSPGRYLTNAVAEIEVGEEAELEHYRIQREDLQAFHLSATQAGLARAGRYLSTSFSLGAGFARNDLGAALDGEEAVASLYGLYLAAGDQFVDNHTVIDHRKPRCQSYEVYKGVVDGRARAVFNGKVFVRKDAQKTDAKQTNKNLLLSDQATVNTKPQLEIFADDVKCTHGATVGQPDEQQIFYLKSRGLDEGAALRLLTYGFAAEIINRIPIEPLKAELDRILLERVGGEKE